MRDTMISPMYEVVYESEAVIMCTPGRCGPSLDRGNRLRKGLHEIDELETTFTSWDILDPRSRILRRMMLRLCHPRAGSFALELYHLLAIR